MAMLAEPRSRKRYNLCPRGKALYEDDSRFGTKMLEKWGWEKGRGLGANEDGEQEFVRVRFKNDAEGLGFEARDDQWTTHEEGFNGLLKTLNGEENQPNGSNGASESEDEMRTVGFGFKTEPQTLSEDAPKKLKEKISGVSLEEKSKHSKARVHYKKFTRGKDLSQYSEKDLANIFGKKVNEELKKKEEPEDKEVNPNFSGVHTLSTGLSVQDYFKQKMEAIKKRLQNGGDQKEEKQLEESNDKDEKDEPQIEEETGFKKNRNSKKIEENEVLEEPVDAGTEEMVKKKEKKSKKSKEIEEFTEEPLMKKKKSKKSKEMQENAIKTEDTEEICKEPEESVEKKKKSKKTKEITEEEVIRTEEVKNICKDTEESVEKQTRKAKETPEEAPLLEESLKKKKKSKKQKELELDIQEQVIEEPPIPEESNKKKSKKQKKLELDSFINSPEIQEPQETVVLTLEESYKKKSKKQKKSEIEKKLPEEPIPEESFRKKSKKQTKSNEIQDQLPVEPQETVVTISEESFKKKSKKRKENIEQKQPEDPLETAETLSEEASKKKKKSENSITSVLEASITPKPSKKKRDFDTTELLALQPALKKPKKSSDETVDQPPLPKNFI